MALQEELTNERNRRFTALLKPCYSDCQRWAYSLAQDIQDADEILAQSVMIGLENVHQLKKDGAFKTWMFKIMANVHRQMIRKQKRLPEYMDHEKLNWNAPRDDEWDVRSDLGDIIRRALGELSPDQRKALVLFESQGLSIREVSGVLGKKETAVRVMLHRAKKRMAEYLTAEGIVPDGSGFTAGPDLKP